MTDDRGRALKYHGLGSAIHPLARSVPLWVMVYFQAVHLNLSDSFTNALLPRVTAVARPPRGKFVWFFYVGGGRQVCTVYCVVRTIILV